MVDSIACAPELAGTPWPGEGPVSFWEDHDEANEVNETLYIRLGELNAPLPPAEFVAERPDCPDREG